MPPRKRKTVDAPIVDPNKPVTLTVFGWCSTGHHDGCQFEFTGHQCSCNCHGGTTIEVDEETAEQLDSSDEI